MYQSGEKTTKAKYHIEFNWFLVITEPFEHNITKQKSTYINSRQVCIFADK